MATNPEQALEFCLKHINDDQYRQIYQRLGFVRSDLEQVDLSAVAKQSKDFMKGLDEGDKEYYLQKKYEAMVLRREKIVREVNEEYENATQTSRNASALTERVDSKHPIMDKLRQGQSVFYDKQSKYYDKVTSLRLKKFREAQQVQDNSYLNSSHYKTLRQKNSSLSLSDHRSAKTYTDRSRSLSATDQKRKKVYDQAQMRKNFELELRKRNFTDKEQRAREKVESVYRNLRIVTMEKKYRSQVENQIVQKNKEVVRKEILEDIYKKKARTTRQMRKFENNRKEQIYKRDEKIMSQKTIHVQRQRSVEEYIQNVIKRNRQVFSHHLQRQLQQAQQNKKRLEELRRNELKQAAQLHQQRQYEANMTKEMLQVQKDKRNRQMFMAYTKNLHQAIQTRDKRVKSVKTKLLDERIKDELASKNQVIIHRQQQLRKKDIATKLKEKNQTIDQIQKLKHRLVEDRRVFLGRTLKKLRILDRELGGKLGKIETPSIVRRSRLQNSFDKIEKTTASKIIVQQ